MRLSDLDWSQWTPRDVATLLFVVRGHETLLIRKKRGLGAGKVNAPGGRLEPGEGPLACAIREVQEELGVTPIDPLHRGELRFHFVDGYTLHAHVFRADTCEGEARETDEAVPLWTPLDAIPYDQMWRDDALWLPKMLAGYRFDGRFIFENDAMLDHDLVLEDPAAPLWSLLRELGIELAVAHHPPVFTVAQAARHETFAGVAVKNLFLRARRGPCVLLTLAADRVANLADLARHLGAGGLSFAPAPRLRELLGVEPGSVTPLAAINDRGGAVRVVLDRAVLAGPPVLCHPLTNDRTVAIAPTDLLRLLAATGHEPTLVDLPG